MSPAREQDGRPRSLRWRLSLTYAGVALLTALVLGAVLLTMLQVHFAQRETDHLRKAAAQATRDVLAGTPDGRSLDQAVRVSAYGLQTRVELLDAGGTVVADSGPPQALTADSLAAASGSAQSPAAGAPSAQTRSGKVLETRLPGGAPYGAVTLRVSEAPAEGADIMRGVVLAWIAAAAVAVLAAAVAGYGISSRIARPIVALEQATERMAEGDLTSRADASGDGEIGRLAGSYNRMADQVEQTVSALRRFVSDAAHQIGTPLTALRADLELARDAGVTDDERGRLVARALGHERRLEDLGAKLLQLSRLESGERESHPEVLDLTELAREAADTYASRAEQAGVLLELDGNAPVRAIADPARLRTAVENLLDNAVKFTPDGGTVVVRSRVDGGLACLEVIDTGRGIPTEDRTRVFERFHRARNAADTPGSGLGLAIAQAAVEGSDGKVALESGPEGTTARLSLRLAATA